MRVIFTLLLFVVASLSVQAINVTTWQKEAQQHPELAALTQSNADMSLDAFMAMTPKSFQKMTGERLGVKGTLALKAAQKSLKKAQNGGATDMPKGAYIVLVLIGWGFLPMGLMDDWQGNNWWINLILSFLCWLPGVIHGFAKMNEYY